MSAALLLGSRVDFASRRADPTLGRVVYELWVDRFAPPENPSEAAKKYTGARSFMPWSSVPQPGHFDASAGYWTHELQFWGGNLKGVQNHLDYIRDLGVDTLYLRPVFDSFSNHKYDTTDYFRVSPDFGSNQDLTDLIKSCHKAGMKFVLDGVFNHVGVRFKPFVEAKSGGARRSWFTFDKKYKPGYLGYAGLAGLPALNLDNPEVRDYLWNNRDSVVRHWLNAGADGWRLDVAYELGPRCLHELTNVVHKQKPGATVVGEIRGYSSDWFPAVDGVFNFYATRIAKNLVQGKLDGTHAGQMYDDMIADAPYENLLQSWVVLDNGDTERLAEDFPKFEDRKLLEAIQFSLPGSPTIYYGSELAMAGANDPACRAPMRWDLVSPQNPDYAWMKKLSTFRKVHPALRIGDFKVLRTHELLAFLRSTDKLREAVLTVVNPTDHRVTESFGTRVGRAMSWATYKDALTGKTLLAVDGTFDITMEPKSVAFYSVAVPSGAPYDPHRRID